MICTGWATGVKAPFSTSGCSQQVNIYTHASCKIDLNFNKLNYMFFVFFVAAHVYSASTIQSNLCQDKSRLSLLRCRTHISNQSELLFSPIIALFRCSRKVIRDRNLNKTWKIELQQLQNYSWCKLIIPHITHYVTLTRQGKEQLTEEGSLSALCLN
jgi:hypothetical protein